MELERLESELEHLLVKEEVYWKQRSRVGWLRHGDKNTAYFHKHASCRRKRNEIKGLFNANNIFLTDHKEVKVVTEFYSDLFTSRNPSSEEINTIINHVAQPFTQDMLDTLDRPFTSNEVKQPSLT